MNLVVLARQRAENTAVRSESNVAAAGLESHEENKEADDSRRIQAAYYGSGDEDGTDEPRMRKVQLRDSMNASVHGTVLQPARVVGRSVHSAIWGTSSHQQKLASTWQMKRKRKPQHTRMKLLEWLDAKLPIISHVDRRKRYWDLLVISFVLYNAVAVPHQTAFEYRKSFGQSTLDHIVDAVFILDLGITFRTTYIDPTGRKVCDGAGIARHYIKTWFWIDFISDIPFEDIMLLVGSSGGNLTVLSFLKTPRLLRLGRLLRFLEKMKGANTFRILRLLMLMFMIAHWIACGWEILRNFFPHLMWSLPDEGSILVRYLSVYYQSFLLIIGNPTWIPQNNIETVFVCIMLVLGICISAVVVGNMALLVSTLNATAARHTQRLEMVIDATRYLGVPPNMQDRVQVMRILSELPPSIFLEISAHLYKSKLAKLKLLAGTEDLFLEAVCAKLRMNVFPPGEPIFRRGDVGEEACIIHKGVLALLHENGLMAGLLREGDHFGEDALIISSPRTHNCTALSPVDLLLLRASDLAVCLKAFPVSALKVREAAKVRLQEIEAEAEIAQVNAARRPANVLSLQEAQAVASIQSEPSFDSAPQQGVASLSAPRRAPSPVHSPRLLSNTSFNTGAHPTGDVAQALQRLEAMLSLAMTKMDVLDISQKALLRRVERIQKETRTGSSIVDDIQDVGLDSELQATQHLLCERTRRMKTLEFAASAFKSTLTGQRRPAPRE